MRITDVVEELELLLDDYERTHNTAECELALDMIILNEVK